MAIVSKVKKKLAENVPFINVGRLVKLKYQDYKRLHLAQRKPQLPEVINMNANDICNSKCTMCNIWKQKLDFEITPTQLEEVLRDPLFSKIKAVGITGGEPTLREDLPDLYEACCKSLPNLQGLSIITNAIKDKDVIARVTRVSEICDQYGVKFSMMVSLDGYGETHDRIRGVKGNFESAMRVINHFRKNTEIPVAIGCTISKDNLWEVDQLLEFMREEQIYGRFRVAEFIKRLYNEDRGEVIRNFTEEEIFHLQCFFKKLELTFETNPQYIRTYKSIQNILAGGKRTIACPYQSKGLVMDSRGDIHYCAPKSGNLGSSLKNSALDLFNSNLDERQRLLNENCNDCVHDYHAPITYDEYVKEEKETYWRNFFKLKHLKKAPWLYARLRFSKFPKSDRKTIYVTGWYGTETVGDKAILGHILDYYIDKYGNPKFYVSSMHPFLTVKTMQELGVEAEVVPTDSFDFARTAAFADITVMGGGPLMDMGSLAIPLWAFKIAKHFKKETIIFGCGLGPLKQPKFIKTVKELIRLSDQVWLRDSNSVTLSAEFTDRDDVKLFGDPAKYYVQRLDKEIPRLAKERKELACFLREWTTEYRGDRTDEEFLETKRNFERNVASYIKKICADRGMVPVFYPMHTFVVGKDDREFYREFTKAHFNDFSYEIYPYNANVHTTIEAMKSAEMNLCMRFHSVLFAHTLNTDFMAIDYTNGGKITGYLTDNKCLDRMMALQDLANNSVSVL